MTTINRKAEEKITVNNLKLDSFYANAKSVFYVYRCYIDNKIVYGNERWCYTRIVSEGNNLTGMFETKEEIVSQLNSFSCRPIDVEINEI